MFSYSQHYLLYRHITPLSIANLKEFPSFLLAKPLLWNDLQQISPRIFVTTPYHQRAYARRKWSQQQPHSRHGTELQSLRVIPFQHPTPSGRVNTLGANRGICYVNQKALNSHNFILFVKIWAAGLEPAICLFVHLPRSWSPDSPPYFWYRVTILTLP